VLIGVDGQASEHRITLRFAPPRAWRAPGYTALMARGHVDECEDVGRGMAEERLCLAPRREPLNVIGHVLRSASGTRAGGLKPLRVALVSCVKSKQSVPAPARDLYTSALFRGLRAYAELHADRWYVLSAEHGLVEPSAVLAPYEKTLNRMRRVDRDRWAAKVQQQLGEVLPESAEVIVLAGERYREELIPFLTERGCSVTIPLKGMPFGKQLQFLSAARS
jgi:hypothetical protein